MGRTCSQRNNSQNAASNLIWTFLITILFAPMLHAEELVDRLLAEVNGSPVLLSDVKAKVKKGPLVTVSPFPATEADSEFEVALQDVINFKLIQQRAEELEIRIDEERLDEEIERFIARRQITKAQLFEALAQQGMDYEQYRDDFRKQMLLNQFQGREILPFVKITDKDIELLYLNQKGAQSDNVKLTLRQLFVSVPEDAGSAIKEGKEALVQRILRELEGGLEFSKAVKLYSDQSSARESGGLMPALNLRDLRQDMQGVVSQLNEGDYSEPLETSAGYFIFYLEKKEFSGSDEFNQLKPQLEAQLQQQEVMRQTVQWLEDQRRRSEIRIIRDEDKS